MSKVIVNSDCLYEIIGVINGNHCYYEDCPAVKQCAELCNCRDAINKYLQIEKIDDKAAE